MDDIRIRFSVSLACSTKSSQSESGQLANVAMKWSFQVPIALSALLVRCVATGVSSNLIGVVASQLLVTSARGRYTGNWDSTLAERCYTIGVTKCSWQTHVQHAFLTVSLGSQLP